MRNLHDHEVHHKDGVSALVVVVSRIVVTLITHADHGEYEQEHDQVDVADKGENAG